MRPRPPGRDVHIPLGVLAYTGAASPGPHRFIDTRRAGWREFASAKGRRGWWHKLRAGLAVQHAAASVVGAFIALMVVLLAYPWLYRASSSPSAPRTENAGTAHVETVAAGGGPVPPVASASAPMPVVPAHVLGAAAPRSSGGLVTEAVRPLASGVSAPFESVEVPVRRGRRAAESLNSKPRHAAQKAARSGPGQPVQATAALALESPSAAEGGREHASVVNRSGSDVSRSSSLTDVLVAIKDASTVIVANHRGMPTAFRVGDRLPSGAVLTSVDPRGESAQTDHGLLKLE